MRKRISYVTLAVAFVFAGFASVASAAHHGDHFKINPKHRSVLTK